MSTTPRPSSGLSIHAVATAVGLSRATIYQAAEAAQLGCPAHFSFTGSSISYTDLGLCRLVQGLAEIGRPEHAQRLAEIVRERRQQAATAAGVTSPDAARELARRWDLRAEQRGEEAAA